LLEANKVKKEVLQEKKLNLQQKLNFELTRLPALHGAPRGNLTIVIYIFTILFLPKKDYFKGFKICLETTKEREWGWGSTLLRVVVVFAFVFAFTML